MKWGQHKDKKRKRKISYHYIHRKKEEKSGRYPRGLGFVQKIL